MWTNPQETVDLVTFTEEILNRKLHFLCSASSILICFLKKNLSVSFLEKRKTKLSSDELNINVVFIKTVESYIKDDELYSLIDFGKLWIRHFL